MIPEHVLQPEPRLGRAGRFAAAQGISLNNRFGFLRQHQKGGLEGVLRVLFVAQHLAANMQDQPAMPAHQLAEGSFLPLDDKSPEKLSIRETLNRLSARQLAHMPEDRPQWLHGHQICL